MRFAKGKPRPANAGRRKGVRNKRTIAAAARPDALAHLTSVMTSTDGTITPDLKLRAAIALAQYQYPKPAPMYVAVDGYEEPKTVEEARALILKLGTRLAKGEISVTAHDALVNGIRTYLGDKAAEQQRILDDLADSLRHGEDS
jgi:hypothetical protein